MTETKKITITKEDLDRLWYALEYIRVTISLSGHFKSNEHPGWVEIPEDRVHRSESFLNDAIDVVDHLMRNELKRTEMTELNKNSFFVYCYNKTGGYYDPRIITKIIELLKQWLPENSSDMGDNLKENSCMYALGQREYRQFIIDNLK